MLWRRCVPLFLLAGWVGAAARGDYGPAAFVCRFQDPRITECSGLAASSRSDDWFFTHNDSGDGPIVYAVNRRGETIGTWRLEGASALDWEDMARGPGEGGKPALFLGDIGDNLSFRPLVSVYRIPEPEADPAKRGAETVAKGFVRFNLVYDDGPHNAEALLVHPKSGQLVIVTKSAAGSGVYATTGAPRAAEANRLRKVASLDTAVLPATPGAERDPDGQRLVTGGAFSPTGDRLALRTYTSAYEWPVENGDLARAFRGKPTAIRLPGISGGEAITYSRDGRSLLIASEGKEAPVYELTGR